MVLNECYSVPRHLAEAVTAYDPALRIRWGRASRQVRIERKVMRARPLNPAYFRTDPDGYETARDGYVLEFTFPPHDLAWPKLLYTLKAKDKWRQGGHKAVADRIEREEDAERETVERRRASTFDALARDTYRDLNRVATVPEGAGHRRFDLDRSSEVRQLKEHAGVVN